ncbi:MAG: hypothetical protein U0746_18440 [Gemmataceae bacterium]
MNAITAHAPLTTREAETLIRQGRARPGLRVEGTLKLTGDARKFRLPPDMRAEVLDLSECPSFDELPPGLRCYELNLSGTKVRELPDDLVVESILNLANCEELLRLPAGLTVGTLNLRGCQSLAALPEGLDVWFLDLSGCWNFNGWPRRATIRSGRLVVRGCSALTSLPDYLGTLAAVNVRECPNLTSLPDSLRITGWIDVAQSGLAGATRLPPALETVDLRWQGVPIDERIFLRPETIQLDEILAERNAERRRILLDRFGVARFMQESGAEVLDRDTDAGGPRRLLRVEQPGDEPLVTLSCLCPSTARQYFLRVPPDTKSCHQAAAWIAGFDDPADYRPLLET